MLISSIAIGGFGQSNQFKFKNHDVDIDSEMTKISALIEAHELPLYKYEHTDWKWKMKYILKIQAFIPIS